MDNSNYKDEEILEQYVLGALSEKESLKVEAMLLRDKKMRAQYNQIESDLEKLAFENAILPKAHVKEKLFSKIEIEKEESEQNTAVIPFKAQRDYKIPFAIAAGFALLFGISSFWLYTSLENSKNEMSSLQNEATLLNERLSVIENQFIDTQDWFNAINRPQVLQLVMRGNDISPQSVAIAYINHEDKKVILNPEGLTGLDEDHDYQMWADVDGEMINMGLVPKGGEMVYMNYIERATSLNITVEPAGGNDHPTVERLITSIPVL